VLGRRAELTYQEVGFDVFRIVPVTSALAGLVALGAVLVPGGPVGAATGCVAWGALPARIALAGTNGSTVRTTLRGTAECRGITADNGAEGTLRGPSGNDVFPLRWLHFGARDEATVYAALNRPGTYRLTGGNVQTYDAKYRRIPATWRATTVSVRYAGRLSSVSVTSSTVTATLTMYGSRGWHAHANTAVSLQRRSGSGDWHTIANTRSDARGRVGFGVHLSSRYGYRLVSATSPHVWSASRSVGSSGV
jgi:hypothetical protein